MYTGLGMFGVINNVFQFLWGWNEDEPDEEEWYEISFNSFEDETIQAKHALNKHVSAHFQFLWGWNIPGTDGFCHNLHVANLSIPLRMKRLSLTPRFDTRPSFNSFEDETWCVQLGRCLYRKYSFNSFEDETSAINSGLNTTFFTFNSFEDETYAKIEVYLIRNSWNFQFLWGWNLCKDRGLPDKELLELSIPLRMKLIYFYSLFYTLDDKLIKISHHPLDLSCELGPHGGTTSSCSHGLLHKLKERGRFIYV